VLPVRVLFGLSGAGFTLTAGIRDRLCLPAWLAGPLPSGGTSASHSVLLFQAPTASPLGSGSPAGGLGGGRCGAIVRPDMAYGSLRLAENGVSYRWPAISIQGESAMAKLKKAPGRLIGRWKQEAIAANAGASDEDLAKIINDMARLQGFDYRITPEKVRTTTKKGKGKKPAPAAASAARTTPATAPAPRSTPGISLEDIRAVKGLVDRIGADKVQELAGMLAK
jgi:hypothetical protein